MAILLVLHLLFISRALPQHRVRHRRWSSRWLGDAAHSLAESNFFRVGNQWDVFLWLVQCMFGNLLPGLWGIFLLPWFRDAWSQLCPKKAWSLIFSNHQPSTWSWPQSPDSRPRADNWAHWNLRTWQQTPRTSASTSLAGIPYDGSLHAKHRYMQPQWKVLPLKVCWLWRTGANEKITNIIYIYIIYKIDMFTYMIYIYICTHTHTNNQTAVC